MITFSILPHITKWHIQCMIMFCSVLATYIPTFHAYLLTCNPIPQISRGVKCERMKVSRLHSFQRNVLMIFQRKKRVTSSVTLGNVQRKAPLVECCSLTCIVKKAFYKLKNQWKQSLGWQRSAPQYSYDLHSYCLNFDDGSSNDHMIQSRVC